MFFLPVFYYALRPYCSFLSREEREVLDDTFFSEDEAVPLVRAYRRLVAAKPELDKSGRLDLMRRIVDLAEGEEMLDEESLVRSAFKVG